MTLRWIADENVPQPIIDELRAHGHVVESVREKCPGSSDEHIIAWARQAQAIVLTEDKGFAQSVLERRLEKVGVVLIRLHGVSLQDKRHMILELVDQYDESWKTTLTILNKKKIRRRQT